MPPVHFCASATLGILWSQINSTRVTQLQHEQPSGGEDGCASGQTGSTKCVLGRHVRGHPTANVPGDFAAHRGTAAAATTSASVRRSTVVRSRPTNRRSASLCQEKPPDETLD